VPFCNYPFFHGVAQARHIYNYSHNNILFIP
jgi:hypothetical protein